MGIRSCLKPDIDFRVGLIPELCKFSWSSSNFQSCGIILLPPALQQQAPPRMPGDGDTSLAGAALPARAAGLSPAVVVPGTAAELHRNRTAQPSRTPPFPARSRSKWIKEYSSNTA